MENMGTDPAIPRLADIMGNQRLSSLQKSLAIVRILCQGIEVEAVDRLRFVLESYGLAPRHETPMDVPEPQAGLVAAIREKEGARVDHEIKGCFEVHASRPIEKTAASVLGFLSGYADETEKAVILERILASRHIPVQACYFSRFIDEPEKDNLILRKHALTFIQLRQLLNLKAGPTTRGSLIQDFLAPLASNPYDQAVVLGAYVEELMRRLQKYMKEASSVKPSVMALPIGANPGDLDEMMKRMRDMLPPEVMDQLRKLFSPPEEGKGS